MGNKNNSLSRWISLIYRYSHIYIGKRLEKHEIGKSQYVFLNALYKKDGISQEEISDYLKIDKGTTAKAIKNLEKEGYVIRISDEKDKRAKRVHLTEKALKAKPLIRTTLEGWTDGLWAGFSEEEKQLTLKMIGRIADNAVALLERENR